MVAPKIKMKAILHKEFGGPEVLEVNNDVEIPQIEKHEVLIQVHAAGINRQTFFNDLVVTHHRPVHQKFWA